MTRCILYPLLGIAILAALLAAAFPAKARDLLWQTNAGGSDIHIIDTATGELVKRLEVGANPHGLAAPANGKMVFVSLEKNGDDRGELLWIDRSSFEILHRLEVGPEPHAIAVTPDGRWVYVPCRDGFYWVIDARERRVVKKIRTGGRPHNTTASPDGRFMYLSPMGEPRAVSIVDVAAGHRVVGTIAFSESVRPPALASARGLFFQHVDGLNGFEVAEIADRQVTARVQHNTCLGLGLWPRKLGFFGMSGLNRCHGLAVRPGSDEIWSVCGNRVNVHGIAGTDFPETAPVLLPGKGYWLTFSPDGRHAFVAISSENTVAMVEASSKEVIRQFDTGSQPKRNLVISDRR